jgi:signal transduction histidine kinase
MFQATLNLIRQMIPVDRASVFLIHGTEGVLRCKAAFGIPEELWPTIKIPVGVALVGKLMEEKRPILIHNVRESEYASLLRAGTDYSGDELMAAPVLIEGHAVGILTASSQPESEPWTNWELQILIHLADTLALALNSAHLARTGNASLAQLKGIFSSVRLGLITTDAQGLVTMITTRARQLLGIPDKAQEQMVPLADLLPSDVSSQLTPILDETLEFAIETSTVLSLEHAETQGSPLVDVTILPIVGDASEPLGALITVNSLEVQRQLQELRRVDDIKTAFLARVSHEFRTPLTALGGSVHLLRELIQEPSARSLVDILDRNTKRLNRVLENLIELMQIQNESLQVELAEVDVLGVGAEVLEEFQALAEEREVRLEAKLKSHTFRTDARIVKRILGELVDNGIKFSTAGQVVVVRSFAEGEVWGWEVEDQGPGIDPALRSHLFQAFEQGEYYKTRTIGGVGLGLNLAYLLAREIGGSLTETGKESGACFRLQFSTGNKLYRQ